MKVALLLVDIQRDYLVQPGLAPAAGMLLERIARLLTTCRAIALPVLHAHTRTEREGINRMAHLHERDIWYCVEGTPGAATPPEAEPLPAEEVFYKYTFNALTNDALQTALTRLGVRTLIIAGVHLHACVRETALAAYQLGYQVWIVDDAVASYDLLHAEVSREYLGNRGMEFLTTDEVLIRLDAIATPVASNPAAPAAWIDGQWQTRTDGMHWEQHNPSRWEDTLRTIAEASSSQIGEAVETAVDAQQAWTARTPQSRGEILLRVADAIEQRYEQFAQTMVTETGKPVREAQQEVKRGITFVRSAISRFCNTQDWQPCGADVYARRSPLGVVAVITPFNHPLAIPLGKLAPALALGNAVVWKPALPTTATAALLVDTFVQAGLPAGLINIVHGDGYTAQRLVRQPQVAGATVTASIEAGRQLAMLCGAAMKPFQAELGGNNAVIVMGDADPATIVRSAFSFAGQRCTAARRILVESSRYQALLKSLIDETAALRLGDPLDETTDVGPLISRSQLRAVAGLVADAQVAGARVVYGGTVPAGLEHGCWYTPTLITDVAVDSDLFRNETFGPVAIVHPVTSIEEAIELTNSVPHGLVATLYSEDAAVQQVFLDAVRTGVVKLNCAPAGVHPEAPFGGWKSSGLGPPEHGQWDEEFYTRPQALYGCAHHRPLR